MGKRTYLLLQNLITSIEGLSAAQGTKQKIPELYRFGDFCLIHDMTLQIYVRTKVSELSTQSLLSNAANFLDKLNERIRVSLKNEVKFSIGKDTYSVLTLSA